MKNILHGAFKYMRTLFFGGIIKFLMVDYYSRNALRSSYLVCPILCARAAACRSFWGLKSLSTKITVSADTRFKPCPPEKQFSFIIANLFSVSIICMRRRSGGMVRCRCVGIKVRALSQYISYLASQNSLFPPMSGIFYMYFLPK